MKKYDNYKDSGIEWIGEIPEHWEMWKISHSFKRIGSGTTPESGNSLYHENGTINWLNTGDLNEGTLNSCAKKITEKALEDYSTLKTFPSGSLVMAMYGATIGKTSIINFDTTTNQACCVFCEGEIIDVKFLQYWFIGNKEHIINLAIGGGQPNISQNILKDVRVSCPSFNEQQSIANYLDHKTTQINTLIAKKEQFITLLQEERTAVINQAVTKGLDPKVKMKDSGIEWLGEIPDHWEVKKLKYIKSNVKNAFVDGPFGSNLKTEHFVENGDVYVIDSGLITSGVFHKKREMKTITKEHFETVERSECKQNDIIIAKIGANFGMSGILPKLDKPSLVSGNTLKLTVNEEIFDLKLIHLQLLNLKTNGEIDLLVKGSAQPALSMGVMSDLPFVLPNTLDEQVTIRNYILNQHQRIDDLLAKAQQEIELLKEYKTALISKVVTGKVDVRNKILD